MGSRNLNGSRAKEIANLRLKTKICVKQMFSILWQKGEDFSFQISLTTAKLGYSELSGTSQKCSL